MNIRYWCFFILLVAASFATSCNNHKTNDTGEELDTVWNDKVQTAFFGAVFGEDVETVKAKVESQGFYFMRSLSTDDRLAFCSFRGQYFSFGGMTWKFLELSFDNEHFSQIRLYNPNKDKISALDNYKEINRALSSKYKATEVEPKDTTVYGVSMFFGKNKVVATAVCYRYESVDHSLWIASELMYNSLEDFGDATDEL